MNHDSYEDDYILDILNTVRSVAIVGASANVVRPSFFVAKYLVDKGYAVYPVNPGQVGKQIAGQLVYASLEDIPVAIDMVDIFRPSHAIPGIAGKILELNPLPKVAWMQLSIRNDETAKQLESAGIKVVMNRCPKIEYGRLSGEINWSGVNSSMISSKKPKLKQGFGNFGIRRS